jgi:hypothetical protein
VATGSHGDASQLEVTELLVVLRELALTLQNSDTDLGLVVCSSGEGLGLLGGDSGVSSNKTGKNATHGLNTEGQGSHIKEQNVLDITSEHSTLDSSANSDCLVGVNTTVGLLAEEALNEFANLGHTSGATNEQHFVDLVLGEARIFKAVFKRLSRSVDVVFEKTLKLCSGQLQVQVLGA